MFFRALIFFIFLCLSTFTSFSQRRKSAFGDENATYDHFVADYRKALKKGLTEKTLNTMFRKYDNLLTPHSDVTRLKQSLEGRRISIFPLAKFKASKLYTFSINKLLYSNNSHHRILAYLVIAASGDTSKEDILLKKIKTEHNAGNLIWSGMALLYLGCEHTTPLFDFLVKNENFGDAHMLPLYIRLNKDSLQQTAYSRINSSTPMAKILAAQILSVTTSNPKTEELLLDAVKNWDLKIKGYAIYSVKELQLGNLLQTFRPLLDSPQTRHISLEALANSPTEADRNYVYQLIDAARDTVPDELLDCLYKSKRADNVSRWLKLLSDKPVSANYLFFVMYQPLIASDNLLSNVQEAVEHIKQPQLLGQLVRVLEGRTDDRSIDILIKLLNHDSPTVRYWTAETLKDNTSPKVKTKEVRELIDKGLKDG